MRGDQGENDEQERYPKRAPNHGLSLGINQRNATSGNTKE
jgi:hypothetical protein